MAKELIESILSFFFSILRKFANDSTAKQHLTAQNLEYIVLISVNVHWKFIKRAF